MRRIYLDYAATTPTHPAVMKEMEAYFTDDFGNPSSIHSYGQQARGAVEEARARVAGLIGAQDKEIIFTGGGTEADNLAVKGMAYASEGQGNHIITSAIEHHAVLRTCQWLEKRGYRVTYLPVDKYGLVDTGDVSKAITDKTVLISVMSASNEVGTIQPVAEIGEIAQKAGVCFHTDAVQAVGHIPVDVNELKVDLLSISAHKLYGPKGIGALYVRDGVRLVPLMHGGEQERGQRPSTENVPGIVGFGKAIELAGQEMTGEAERITKLRDKLISGIMAKIEGTCLNGHPVRRLPNNVNISVDVVDGEAMLLNLDLEGMCVSTGSACSSATDEPSHVLRAMGLSSEQASSSLRFSLGKWTADEDIERVLDVLPGIVGRLRVVSPLFKKS